MHAAFKKLVDMCTRCMQKKKYHYHTLSAATLRTKTLQKKN